MTQATAAEPEPSGFEAIVRKDAAATLERVAGYIRDNPDADDIPAARRWILTSASQHGLEQAVIEIARSNLTADGLTDDDAALSRRVLAVGLARNGQLDEAVATFQVALRSVRLRSPGPTIDFAKELANHAQYAGDFEAVRGIYDQLSAAYFLNTLVRRVCDSRLRKLNLIGETAPAIDSTDVSGQAVRLSDSNGHVVLVDFWATNCPPCLEEFPRLKQLYGKYHDRGFDIIGVSLDDSASFVSAFQEQAELPWPLVMNEDGGSEIRTAYQVDTIPSTLLIDRSGKIAAFDVHGPLLERHLVKLLGDTSE